MNRRELGQEKEEEACRYLTKQGFVVKERNFRCRQGEIDIIGRHQGYLVFAEVKYRKNDSLGSAEEAVNIKKQRKICQAAGYYRCIHRYNEDYPIRYDVVAIQGEQIIWYQNAFEHGI